MSGEEMKIVIRRLGYTQKAVAELLQETPQNLGSMLEAKDIKSSLVERVARALEIPIAAIYGESVATTVTGSTAIVGNGNKGNSLNANESRLLALLEEKDRQIARLLDLLQAAGGEKR